MRKIDKNYNLFDAYAFYAPGVGGMFALLGWLLLGMLLGSAVNAVISLVSPAFALTYGILISYPLQFMPVMIWASSKSRRAAIDTPPMPLNQSNFGNNSFAAIIVVVIIATIAMGFIMDIIGYGIYKLTLLSDTMTAFYDAVMNIMKSMTGGPLWVSLLSVSIMAPLFEEWLCRGEILRGLLKKGMHPAWAILISALFFAVIHGNPWQAIPAMLIGCLLGYVYYKTGSLWLTMIMHCANNTLAVILSNIESFKNVEYWYDVIPTAPYWIYFSASVVILIASVQIFSKIPNLPTSTSCKPEGTNP